MTSTVDDYLKVLSKYEKDLVAVLKQADVVKLPTELLRNRVISSSLKERLDSIDYDHLSSELLARYLLQQVGELIKKNVNVLENFLQVLAGLDSKGKEVYDSICDELDLSYESQDFAVGCDKGQMFGEKKERVISLQQEDVSHFVEILAEISDKWNEIGIMLGLPRHVRKDCDEGSSVVSFSNILCCWISSEQATLGKLKAALNSKVVGAGRMVQALDKNFKTTVSTPAARPRRSLSTLLTYQSSDTEVTDGKSTLLEVQVSATEFVSYQWVRDGQLLQENENYSGVHNDILLINQVNHASEGSYQCFVNHSDKKACSDKIKLVVKCSPIKMHILNLYSKFREVPVDLWPPVGTSAFINLTMAKSSKLCTDRFDYELQGSADRVMANKEAVKYEEAFKLYEKGSLILLEGRPGSGKSSLIQKIVLDWASGVILKGAVIVFLIPLHHHCLSGSEGSLFHVLNAIFCQGHSNHFLKDDIQRIEDRDGEGVCFVLDGLDEYHPEDKRQSVILKVLHKTYLPEAMVIVSSRPVATSSLKQKDIITECYDVMGFSKGDIFNFIDSFPFSKVTENKANPQLLKVYLDRHSNVLNMCYLPVNAAIICSLYDDRKGDIPTTETKIYEEFVKLVIVRHFKRNNRLNFISSLQDLSGKDKENFTSLCQIAHDMTFNSGQVFSWSLTSSESDDSSYLGLVTVDRIIQLTNPEARQTCTFLHFTFQEFLAAYYLAQLDFEALMSKIKENSLNSKPHLLNVWKFYSGLVRFGQRDFLMFLYYAMGQVKITNFILFPFLFAFESQLDIVCEALMEVTPGIAFEAHLKPSDINAISHVISRSKEGTDFITFCLLNRCTDEDGFLKIFSHVHDDRICLLSNLSLSNLSLGSAGAQAIAARLKYCKNLRVLDLSHNCLCSSDVFKIFLHQECIKEFNLSNNNIDDDIIKSVPILSKLHFESLDISYCRINFEGIKALCDLKKSVYSLYLQGNARVTCVDLINFGMVRYSPGSLHISVVDFEDIQELEKACPNANLVKSVGRRRSNSFVVFESHFLIKHFNDQFWKAVKILLFPYHRRRLPRMSAPLPSLDFIVYLY